VHTSRFVAVRRSLTRRPGVLDCIIVGVRTGNLAISLFLSLPLPVSFFLSFSPSSLSRSVRSLSARVYMRVYFVMPRARPRAAQTDCTPRETRPPIYDTRMENNLFLCIEIRESGDNGAVAMARCHYGI